MSKTQANQKSDNVVIKILEDYTVSLDKLIERMDGQETKEWYQWCPPLLLGPFPGPGPGIEIEEDDGQPEPDPPALAEVLNAMESREDV